MHTFLAIVILAVMIAGGVFFALTFPDPDEPEDPQDPSRDREDTTAGSMRLAA